MPNDQDSSTAVAEAPKVETQKATKGKATSKPAKPPVRVPDDGSTMLAKTLRNEAVNGSDYILAAKSVICRMIAKTKADKRHGQCVTALIGKVYDGHANWTNDGKFGERIAARAQAQLGEMSALKLVMADVELQLQLDIVAFNAPNADGINLPGNAQRNAADGVGRRLDTIHKLGASAKDKLDELKGWFGLSD